MALNSVKIRHNTLSVWRYTYGGWPCLLWTNLGTAATYYSKLRASLMDSLLFCPAFRVQLQSLIINHCEYGRERCIRVEALIKSCPISCQRARFIGCCIFTALNSAIYQ
jgi:hypothetical protein